MKVTCSFWIYDQVPENVSPIIGDHLFFVFIKQFPQSFVKLINCPGDFHVFPIKSIG